jgi:hypothetical protein
MQVLYIYIYILFFVVADRRPVGLASPEPPGHFLQKGLGDTGPPKERPLISNPEWTLLMLRNQKRIVNSRYLRETAAYSGTSGLGIILPARMLYIPSSSSLPLLLVALAGGELNGLISINTYKCRHNTHQ